MEIAYAVIIIGLLILVILSFYAGRALGRRYMFEVMSSVIEKERKDAINRSRSVLTGQFSEQLAPILPDFPADPSEVRFIGKPIDFIAFRGLNEKHITEVIFIEVKTGKSQMNGVEKSLRDAIQNRRVRFMEFRKR